MVNIYILELEDGKFYVGKTNHTVQRFNQHNDGKGSKWTKKYPMVDLYDFHRDMKDADENRITMQMIRKFGAANVRGGSWTKVNMTRSEIRSLDAKAKKGRYQRAMPKRRLCNRCGRSSHTDRSCYARYHANGKSLTRKKSVSKQDYADFVVEYKQRRAAAVKAEHADGEKVEAELKMLEKIESQPEEKIIEVLETLSEEEEVDDNTDLFEEIFGPLVKTIEDAKKVVKSIKKAQKKATKFGKRISKGLKKNLGLK